MTIVSATNSTARKILNDARGVSAAGAGDTDSPFRVLARPATSIDLCIGATPIQPPVARLVATAILSGGFYRCQQGLRRITGCSFWVRTYISKTSTNVRFTSERTLIVKETSSASRAFVRVMIEV